MRLVIVANHQTDRVTTAEFEEAMDGKFLYLLLWDRGYLFLPLK